MTTEYCPSCGIAHPVTTPADPTERYWVTSTVVPWPLESSWDVDGDPAVQFRCTRWPESNALVMADHRAGVPASCIMCTPVASWLADDTTIGVRHDPSCRFVTDPKHRAWARAEIARAAAHTVGPLDTPLPYDVARKRGLTR